MAPLFIPEEVDVFSVPHLRMKELVNNYYDMIRSTNFTSILDLQQLLEALSRTFREFKSHEQIENRFIMKRLKMKMRKRSVKNSAVCNCHKDNAVTDMMLLLEDGYNKKTEQDRLNYGLKLKQALEDFTDNFLPHMKEEEEVFQPLLLQFFSYEELCELKRKVMQQHFEQELEKSPWLNWREDTRQQDSSTASSSDSEPEESRKEKEDDSVLVPEPPVDVSTSALPDNDKSAPRIDVLPPEVLMKVFECLGPRDLSRCQRVNMAWNRLALDASLWKNVLPGQWAKGGWSFEKEAVAGDADDDVGYDDSGDEVTLDDDADIDESDESDYSKVVRRVKNEMQILNGLTDFVLPKVGANVQRLVLVNCHTLTNGMLQKFLTLCPNVEHLDLSYTRITDAGLRRLGKNGCGSKLKTINLSGCVNVTDGSLVRIALALSDVSSIRAKIAAGNTLCPAMTEALLDSDNTCSKETPRRDRNGFQENTTAPVKPFSKHESPEDLKLNSAMKESGCATCDCDVMGNKRLKDWSCRSEVDDPGEIDRAVDVATFVEESRLDPADDDPGENIETFKDLGSSKFDEVYSDGINNNNNKTRPTKVATSHENKKMSCNVNTSSLAETFGSEFECHEKNNNNNKEPRKSCSVEFESCQNCLGPVESSTADRGRDRRAPNLSTCTQQRGKPAQKKTALGNKACMFSCGPGQTSTDVKPTNHDPDSSCCQAAARCGGSSAGIEPGRFPSPDKPQIRCQCDETSVTTQPQQSCDSRSCAQSRLHDDPSMPHKFQRHSKSRGTGTSPGVTVRVEQDADERGTSLSAPPVPSSSGDKSRPVSTPPPFTCHTACQHHQHSKYDESLSLEECSIQLPRVPSSRAHSSNTTLARQQPQIEEDGCHENGSRVCCKKRRHRPAGCQRLEELNLSGCFQITDVGLGFLASCGEFSRLHTVDFSGCFRLTAGGLGTLVSVCPALDKAELFYCDNIVDGPFSEVASGCRNLQCSRRVCCRSGD